MRCCQLVAAVLIVAAAPARAGNGEYSFGLFSREFGAVGKNFTYVGYLQDENPYTLSATAYAYYGYQFSIQGVNAVDPLVAKDMFRQAADSYRAAWTLLRDHSSGNPTAAEFFKTAQSYLDVAFVYAFHAANGD